MIPTPSMSHNSNPSIIVTSSTDTSMSAANASIAPMNFNTGSLLPIASMNNGSFGRSEGNHPPAPAYPIDSVVKDHMNLDEALAVWEVSRILEISFKGGRSVVMNRVCEIEDDLQRMDSDKEGFFAELLSFVERHIPRRKLLAKAFYDNLFKNTLTGTNWTGLVWRGVAPPKVELFTWLVIRQRIPVRVELMRKGMISISDNLCPLCRNDLIFEKGRLDVQHLFFSVIARLVLWFKAKHQNVTLSVESLMFDPSVADRLSLIGKVASCVSAWKAPPFGFLKLNVDGAMLRNGRLGGVSGILRNCEGRCLATFSEIVGQGTSVLAELLALSYGLGLFFRSKWGTTPRLVLESDSSLAVEWVFQPDRCPPMFVSLARTIRRVIDENLMILWHILRGCNVEADSLAKASIG
ncbi:hypothetical protein V6N12_035857 [Hibiscus sabdariffa]|uniref:RNase H type-1 domain-containing protein n=1 Tax=Hibiscus sabdariffa TaxID=183260 RepID=A0ABR2EST9_9ROSI